MTPAATLKNAVQEVSPGRVHVTAADIAAGVARDCAACPVALALDRATGGAWTVWVWRARSAAGDHFTLPPAVQAWLWRFDHGHPVEPFAFSIPTPTPRLLLVNKVSGRHGELLVDECVGPDGARGVTNVRGAALPKSP